MDQLPLLQPFCIGTLCSELSKRRRRPLHLHPIPLDTSEVCGLWIGTDAEDHIFYEQHTARSHQEHIILHEIGHMLFGHRSDASVASVASGVSDALFPDLDTRLVRRVLGRTNYSSRQEQEAEMLASLIRAGDAAPTWHRPPGVYGKLHAALGVSAPS